MFYLLDVLVGERIYDVANVSLITLIYLFCRIVTFD